MAHFNIILHSTLKWLFHSGDPTTEIDPLRTYTEVATSLNHLFLHVINLTIFEIEPRNSSKIQILFNISYPSFSLLSLTLNAHNGGQPHQPTSLIVNMSYISTYIPYLPPHRHPLADCLRKYGVLNISQPYRTPRPGMGIALILCAGVVCTSQETPVDLNCLLQG
jgi:hypothetical protein